MTVGDWLLLGLFVVAFFYWPICTKLDDIREELRAIRKALERKHD